jgi:hypothetical protein
LTPQSNPQLTPQPNSSSNPHSTPQPNPSSNSHSNLQSNPHSNLQSNPHSTPQSNPKSNIHHSDLQINSKSNVHQSIIQQSLIQQFDRSTIQQSNSQPQPKSIIKESDVLENNKNKIKKVSFITPETKNLVYDKNNLSKLVKAFSNESKKKDIISDPKKIFKPTFGETNITEKTIKPTFGEINGQKSLNDDNEIINKLIPNKVDNTPHNVIRKAQTDAKFKPAHKKYCKCSECYPISVTVRRPPEFQNLENITFNNSIMFDTTQRWMVPDGVRTIQIISVSGGIRKNGNRFTHAVNVVPGDVLQIDIGVASELDNLEKENDNNTLQQKLPSIAVSTVTNTTAGFLIASSTDDKKNIVSVPIEKEKSLIVSNNSINNSIPNIRNGMVIILY